MRQALAALLCGMLLVLMAGVPTAVTAAEPQRVQLEPKALPDRGQLQLIWPPGVDPRLTIEDGLVRVRSTPPVLADPASTRARLAPWLAGAEAAAAVPGELLLRLRPGVTARTTQPRPRLSVIELVAGAARAPVAGTAGPQARLTATAYPGFGLLVIGGDGRPPWIEDAPPGTILVAAGAMLPADTPARLKDLRSYVTRVTVEGQRLRLELAPGVQGTPTPLVTGELALDLRHAASRESARQQRPAAPASARRTTPTALFPPRPVARPALAAPTPPLEPAAGPAEEVVVARPAPSGVTIRGHADAQGAELRFVWPGEVPAALFERSGTLWAVFAAPSSGMDGWEGLGDGELGGWLKPVEARVDGDIRLFRLALQRGARVEMDREGPAWILRLRPATGEGAALPPEGVERDTVGGSLRGSQPTRGFLVRDPDSGEQLGVLLATRGTLRHPAPMRLVDVEILPSAQGLAWRPLADGVKATAGPTGFVLSRRGGLRFSARQDGSAAGDPSGAADPRSVAVEDVGEAVLPAAPLTLAGLANSTPQDRQEARTALMARLPGLAPVPAALGRLELARLNLADGLAPETRAALARLDADRLPPAAARAVRRSGAALEAAAAALEGRHEAALAALQGKDLDGDPEIALWRAYAASGAERHELAGQEWERGQRALASLPTPLRRTLGREIATSLAQHGDPNAARTLLDLLRPLAQGAPSKAELQLLRGVAAARGRRPEDADAPLLAAAEGGDANTRVRAAFVRTVLQHERGELDAAAAADELAAQRRYWAGHAWEARMLRQLAALQGLAGDPLAAFATSLELAERGEAKGSAETTARLKDLLRAAGEGRVAAVTAAAVHGTHGRLLDGDPQAPELRRLLALRVAQAGLAGAAEELLRQAGNAEADNPTATAARRAIEGLRAEDDEALEPSRAVLLQRQDWPALARASEAALARRAEEGPLDEEAAADLVALALAKARQGAPAEAALLAARHDGRLPEGPWRSLLGLIGATALSPTSAEEAVPITTTLVDSLRKQLERLPPLEARQGDALPKTADSR